MTRVDWDDDSSERFEKVRRRKPDSRPRQRDDKRRDDHRNDRRRDNRREEW
jgi:hypothetical protein